MLFIFTQSTFQRPSVSTWDKRHLYFKTKETEAQRGQVTCQWFPGIDNLWPRCRIQPTNMGFYQHPMVQGFSSSHCSSCHSGRRVVEAGTIPCCHWAKHQGQLGPRICQPTADTNWVSLGHSLKRLLLQDIGSVRNGSQNLKFPSQDGIFLLCMT